ncbi:uncharacterized protein TRIADDRAFT_62712 [Trichoplax adhaerens]|uniref:Uncharacterized protein n=1 Tax=Trichoplax adhaerens TaxID=10228 RepID=B3SEM5_TRIAD|nr:hypothetical protein TRIADDRAFT_62712 [Trichoplax adhaerens]EDV18820.1 hypothetical protein TRIADDRAFT_62712 [Trichoplax adhaerens]|eukprot:XP_002118694.1 hypothetical protein TRIADDRAFT_62712 [Trichoplax adhaerens]
MGDRVRLIEYYLLGFHLANHEANQKEIEVMVRASGNQALLSMLQKLSDGDFIGVIDLVNSANILGEDISNVLFLKDATAQDLIQDKVSSYLSSTVDEDQSNDRIASDALPRVQELNSCAQKLLSCDEEPPYPLADFYGLLWISRLLLFNCRNQLSCLKTAPIWCIRCLYAHQQLFNDTIPDLMQAIFAQIDIVTEGLLQEEDFPSLLCCQVYVEFSHLKRCYCGYFQAKKLLRKAESVIGLKLELAGRLGKRTRFQEKKLAQLTASIKCETLKDNRISIEEFSKLETAALPKDVTLDDDTVMHRIKFSDNQGDIPVLLPIEEIVILANGYARKRSW